MGCVHGGRLAPQLSKLRVAAGDATPISIVNLRSAIQSVEAEELDRQLAWLSADRLSREREVFVLERRQMDLLSEEKDLQALDESSFWNGSYLLDGVIDRDGYAPEKVTVNARLSPPNGATPLAVEVSGSRTNLPEVVDRLVARIMEALKRKPNAVSYTTAEEAALYLDEAKWAFRWRMLDEAQEASESSWALGLRSKELAELRIRVYREQSLPDWDDSPLAASKLAKASRALQLFGRDFDDQAAGGEGMPDMNWFYLGLDLLDSSSMVLHRAYAQLQARQEFKEDQLADLRQQTRETANRIGQYPLYQNLSLGINVTLASRQYPERSLASTRAAEGVYWHETPDECLRMYQALARSNLLGSVRRLLADRNYSVERDANRPLLIGWNEQDAQRASALWQGFLAELCASTNGVTRIEGCYLQAAASPPGQPFTEAIRQLYRVIVENAAATGDVGSSFGARLSNDIDRLLNSGKRHDILFAERAAFSSNWLVAARSGRRRQQVAALTRFLSEHQRFDPKSFRGLWQAADIEEAEARNLLPLVNDYKAWMFTHAGENPPLFSGSLLAVTNELRSFERSLQNALGPRMAAAPPRPAPKAIAPAAKRTEITNAVTTALFHNLPVGSVPADDNHVLADTDVASFCMREGKFWLEVRYRSKVFIFGVKLDDFTAETIELPLNRVHFEKVSLSSHPSEDRHFEVWRGSVYFASGEGILRYSLQTKCWDTVPLPTLSRVFLAVVADRLFLSTADSIIELAGDGQTVRLLASNRRRPPSNLLDSIPAFGSPPLFAGPAGSLRAFVQSHIYTFDDSRNQWSETAALPAAANGMFSGVFESATVFRCLDGDLTSRWFVLRNSACVLELGIMHTNIGGFGRPPRQADVPSQTPKTRWLPPPGVSLQDCPFTMKGEDLFIFSGALSMRLDAARGLLFEEVSGDPMLLFTFDRTGAPPVATPVRFELNSDVIPEAELRKFGGVSRPTPQGNVRFYSPGQVYLQSTPSGILVGAQNLHGFWLFPLSDERPSEGSVR